MSQHSEQAKYSGRFQRDFAYENKGSDVGTKILADKIKESPDPTGSNSNGCLMNTLRELGDCSPSSSKHVDSRKAEHGQYKQPFITILQTNSDGNLSGNG